MKLKVVGKKLYDYIRYDLKEIAFPSSLPDPPHIKKRRKLTWQERFLVSRSMILLLCSSTKQFGSPVYDFFLGKCIETNVCMCLCPYFVVQVLKEACRLYAASWVRDIGPDLRPNDYKKYEESDDEPDGAKSKTKEREPSTLEDLGNNSINLFFMIWFQINFKKSLQICYM